MGNFEQNLETIAKEYHLSSKPNDKIFDEIFHLELAKKVAPLIETSNNVLELGYGEGTVAAELFSRVNLKRTIIEGSKTLAEQAKKELGSEVDVVHSMFNEYKNFAAFDLILATNVFEHVDNTTQLFSNIHEWLKPDGVCVITVPNSESFHRRLAVEMKLQPTTKELSERDHKVGHLRVYDLASIQHEIRSNGFKILECSGMVIKFLNNSLQLLLPKDLNLALARISRYYPPEYAANIYLEIAKN